MLFPQGDSLQRFYERVPDELMSQRLADYNKLRRAHFSDWEAIKIITTLTKPDKDGKRYLQALDLTTEAWQDTIRERKNWYNKKMSYWLKKGLNRRQARRRVSVELLAYYESRKGDTRKDPTPWSGIREHYKKAVAARPEIDFIDNMRKREKTYRKKKMPYSVGK